MGTPTGDDAFLHELERDIRAELRRAETSEPERRSTFVREVHAGLLQALYAATSPDAAGGRSYGPG